MAISSKPVERKPYPLQAIVVQLLIANGYRCDEIRCLSWQQLRGSRLEISDNARQEALPIADEIP
jgi:hypothetical protein